jgi:DNA-binding transcriptional MocR family regulator
VVVEKPTYDRTLLNLRNLGASVHQVTLTDDGIDVDELRKLLEAGARPVLAHVIPNYQNPAGMTLSLDKRRALLGLAREYEFTIFEDDPYAEIRFRGDRLPSMLSMDEDGAVVHASSFTKTVCPGVRVGYLVGPEALIADIAKRATNLYISPGMVAQAIVPPVLYLRRHRPLDRRRSTPPSRSGPPRWPPRCASTSPASGSPNPTAATSSGSTCPTTSTSTSSRRRPSGAAWRW